VPSTWNNRGYALYELGCVDEALASYRAALALDPDYVKALVNCANALTALDRHDEETLTRFGELLAGHRSIASKDARRTTDAGAVHRRVPVGKLMAPELVVGPV
jgi:tetratricopeptide (TPR) repeat protein